MKKVIYLFVAVAFWAATAVAQERRGVCGTTLESMQRIDAHLTQNLQQIDVEGGVVRERGAVTYVPVFFHLVASSAGQNRLRQRQALDALCKMNQIYAPWDIQFYLSPHPDSTFGLINGLLNDDNIMDVQANTVRMNQVRHPNAINFFIVEKPAPNTQQEGVILGYYTPFSDWLVIKRTEMTGTDVSTIAHETGHYLSLQHTHYGWDTVGETGGDPEKPCFESSDPTWPKAPITSPQGVPTEKVDGSNCGTAGDRICDTPPDYNFGFCAAPGCAPYTGGAQDPTGALVDPMENNIMSYFIRCSDYTFTKGQADVMMTDLRSNRRRALRTTTYTPPALSLSVPTDFLKETPAVAVGATSATATLRWNAVPGATYYLVELDVVNSFSSTVAQSFIVKGTGRTFTGLLNNRNYFWRIRPINEYVVCATPAQGSFRTASIISVRDIAAIQKWDIVPNPAANGTPARLQITATERFEATLRVLDAAGRPVGATTKLSFGTGDSQVDVPTASLPNGVYMVMLESAQGVSVRRLSVLN